MNITYWGSGSYEAIPAPFCGCPVCENAREKKGKEIRTRHSANIDGTIQLDYSPDIFLQTLNGLNLRNVRYLLITHGHNDHFDVEEMALGRHSCSLTGLPRLTVIGNAYVTQRIRDIETLYGHKIDMIEKIMETAYYQPIEIDESTVVTPLSGNHAQEIGGCNLYHISRKGKQLLYAHDSGPFGGKVFEWLSGRQMDAVSLDCTGALLGTGVTHMDIASCDKTVHQLRDDGSLKRSGIVIYSHFSHAGGATHEQLETESKLRGWIPAFDGMSVKTE